MSLVCKRWRKDVFDDPDMWRVVLVTDIPAQKLSEVTGDNSCENRLAVIGDRVRAVGGHSIRKRHGKATTSGRWLLEVGEIAIVVEVEDGWFRLRDPRGLETKNFQNPRKFCFLEQVRTGGSVAHDDAASKYVQQGALPLQFWELRRIPDLGHVEILIVDEPSDPNYKCFKSALPWSDPRHVQHCDWLWLKCHTLFDFKFPRLQRLRLSVEMVECEGPAMLRRRHTVFQWLLDQPKTLQHLKLDYVYFFPGRFSQWLPCSVPEWLPNICGIDHFITRYIGQRAVALWPVRMREQIQIMDAIEPTSSVMDLLEWFKLFPNLERVRFHACNLSVTDLELLCRKLPQSVSALYFDLEHTTPYVYPALAQWGCFAMLRDQLRELFLSFDFPAHRELLSLQELAEHLAKLLPQTAVAAVDIDEFFANEDAAGPHGWPDPMDTVFLPGSVESWRKRPGCYCPFFD